MEEKVKIILPKQSRKSYARINKIKDLRCSECGEKISIKNNTGKCRSCVMNPLDKNKIMKLHNKGLNDIKIAKKLNSYPSAICEWRKKLGLNMQERERRFSDEQLLELHNKGLNDSQIAEKLKVSPSAIRTRRKKLSLENNYDQRLFTDEEMSNLWNKGLLNKDIAEKLNVHEATVGNRLRKLGLRKNKKPTQVNEEKLRECLEKGWNDIEISKVMGCSSEAISYRRKSLGLQSNFRKNIAGWNITDEDFLGEYNKGLTYKEIMASLGISRATIYRKKKKLGLKMNLRNLQNNLTISIAPANSKINREVAPLCA
jgi:DNA-binding NarL/FixJ family response regulator